MNWEGSYLNKKKLIRIVCLISIICIGISSNIVFASEKLPFDIQSKSALLLDFDSGEIIYEKNSDEKLPIASITKIMTILLALESIEEGLISGNDDIYVSSYAQSMGGSTAFLEEGEIFPVSTILKAIIVASANDASVAIAEKISGSHEGFVHKMNQRAKELGMENTHFVNCTGLPDENHYSTARDVAIMSRELLKQPLFFKWSTIWLDEMRDGRTMLKNTNNLVRFYEGCDGIKTGYTKEAMHCISATAKRNNLRLIAIILASPTSKLRFEEASKLLDYGFANYDSVKLFTKGQIIDEAGEIRVTGGKTDTLKAVASDDFSVLLKKDSSKDFEFILDIPEVVRAPVEKGEEIGTLKIVRQGNTIGEIGVEAEKDIGVANLFDIFNKILNGWLKKS